jgi:hypothetical protein
VIFSVLNALTVAAVFVLGLVINAYAAANAVYCAAMAVASPATKPYVAGAAVIKVLKFSPQATNAAFLAGMYGASAGMRSFVRVAPNLGRLIVCVKRSIGSR